MTDKQTDETLDPPVFRLKQMRRLLAEHNYYGNPIDDDFAALDAAITALERQRVPVGWKPMPPKADFGMLESALGWREVDDRESIPPRTEYDMFDRAYRAMFAAAPEPSGD